MDDKTVRFTNDGSSEVCSQCGETAKIGWIHYQGTTYGPVRFCQSCRLIERLEGFNVDAPEPVAAYNRNGVKLCEF